LGLVRLNSSEFKKAVCVYKTICLIFSRINLRRCKLKTRLLYTCAAARFPAMVHLSSAWGRPLQRHARDAKGPYTTSASRRSPGSKPAECSSAAIRACRCSNCYRSCIFGCRRQGPNDELGMDLSGCQITVMLPVKDVDRARGSYESQLALPPGMEKPDGKVLDSCVDAPGDASRLRPVRSM
jgi:hypothetical protein